MRRGASGTASEERVQTPTRRLTLAMASELGAGELEASRIVSALFEVLRREGWRIHDNVPVCTNCRETVNEIAWQAAERLDTVHTDAAAAMIEQAQAGAGVFRADLERRGVKV